MVGAAGDGTLTVKLPLGTSVSDWCGTFSIAALVRGESVIAALSVDTDGEFYILSDNVGFQPAVTCRTVGEYLVCAINFAVTDVEHAICLIAAGNAFGGLITYASDGVLPSRIVASFLAGNVPMLPVLSYAGAELACWVELRNGVPTFILPGTSAQQWDYCQEFDVVSLASSASVESFELNAEWRSNFKLHFPAGQDFDGTGAYYDWGLPFEVYNI